MMKRTILSLIVIAVAVSVLFTGCLNKPYEGDFHNKMMQVCVRSKDVHLFSRGAGQQQFPIQEVTKGETQGVDYYTLTLFDALKKKRTMTVYTTQCPITGAHLIYEGSLFGTQYLHRK